MSFVQVPKHLFASVMLSLRQSKEHMAVIALFESMPDFGATRDKRHVSMAIVVCELGGGDLGIPCIVHVNDISVECECSTWTHNRTCMENMLFIPLSPAGLCAIQPTT